MKKQITVLLVLIIGLLTWPSLVMADPGNCTGKKADRDPGCNTDPPASGDGEFSFVDIRVEYFGTDTMEEACPYDYVDCFNDGNHDFGAGFNNWEANTLEVTPRPCQVGATSNDPPSAGRYDCFNDSGNSDEPWPHGGLISINLSGMVWAVVDEGKKDPKNPEFCDLLNLWSESEVILEYGPTRYQIFFTGGCVKAPGHCDIRIGTASYSGVSPQQGEVLLHPFHGLSDLPDVGRLVVSGGVDEDHIDFPTSPELNVFTIAQSLPINHFRISFNSVKSGALLATCETPVADTGILFETTLVPAYPFP